MGNRRCWRPVACFRKSELQELVWLAFAVILNGKEEIRSYKILISGALQALTDESDREAVIRGVAAGLSEDDMARLLVLAPFGKATWKLVGTLGEAAQAGY